MGKKSATYSSVLVAVVLLWSISCSDNAEGDPWTFEERPESTVNPAYCAALPNEDLTEPVVKQTAEDAWRIRYPSFREGCGAYQLDAIVDFSPEEDWHSDVGRYAYEVTACNRCEQPQALHYLHDFGARGLEGSNRTLKVPPSPRQTSVPGLLPKGAPVVRHETSSSNGMLHEGVCSFRRHMGETFGQGPRFISYRSLFSIQFEPGETRRTTIDYSLDQADEPLWNAASSSQSASILWPRLFHRDAAVTGLRAASVVEYCLEATGYGNAWFRPYQQPYVLEDKYADQRTATPVIPPELVQQLEVYIETRPE
jgi:hypothetical protein